LKYHTVPRVNFFLTIKSYQKYYVISYLLIKITIINR
jgi:hypothetical protein